MLWLSCVAQGEGIPPDVVTTTILVKAQVGSGDVDAGARTLIEMMKSSSLKDQLDAFPFNTIIKVRSSVCLLCIVRGVVVFWFGSVFSSYNLASVQPPKAETLRAG